MCGRAVQHRNDEWLVFERRQQQQRLVGARDVRRDLPYGRDAERRREQRERCLVGATIRACLRTTCASGTLSKRDGGTGYVLPLEVTGRDGGTVVVNGQAQPGTGANVKIRIDWTFGYGASDGVADGDTYTVSADDSIRGQLFSRSFVATYKETSICGSTCKEYTSP